MAQIDIVTERKVSERKDNQNKWVVVAVIALFAAGIILLRYYTGISLLPPLFGFIFGYTLQRSRFCFAASFRDIFMIRNTVLARALLVTIALTTTGFVAVHFFSGISLEMAGKIYPVGLHTVIGGVLFGFGMVIAGNCVSGCLVRLGEGYLAQWYAFTGLIIGSAAGAWNLGWWVDRFTGKSPSIFLPAQIGWPAALLIHFSLIALLYSLLLKFHNTVAGDSILKRDNPRPLPLVKKWIREFPAQKSWPYITGAVFLSLANTLLFLFWGEQWSITAGLTHLSGWLAQLAGLAPESWHYFLDPRYRECCGVGYLDHPLLYLALAMILGSLVSCLLNREFRLRRPRHWKYRLAAFAGGLILGYSSRVALGCNIGGFLGGVSSLSLHGWLFGLAILAGAYLGGKFFMRYLL